MRPQDQIYTVVREPVSLMVSYLNFVLTRVATFAGNEQPPQDVLDMRRAMGLEAGQEVGTEIADAVSTAVSCGTTFRRTRCAVASAVSRMQRPHMKTYTD